MTSNEKKALMVYIEDQLMLLCREMTPELDNDQVGSLYDKAYDVIHDMEDTLSACVELSPVPNVPSSKIKR